MAEHIRIGDVAPRVHYVADGVRTDFPFPFPIFAPEDLEIRVGAVVQTAGVSIAGAGASEGGHAILSAPPPAGATVTLRRRVRIARVTDYQDNGLLRARTLNDELDRIVAAQQESRDEIATALRQDPSEAGGHLFLPLKPVRANRLLGFDSNGDAVTFPRESGLLTAPYPGAVPRTAEDKLSERLSARAFGATGNGTTDDGPALQAAMNAAAASGRTLLIGEGTHRTLQPLTLPGAAVGLEMRGRILYAGPAGQPALTIGDGGAIRNANKLLTGLTVTRATQSDWSNESDIGLVLRNLDASQVEIREVTGFTIGIRTMGDGRGFEDTTLVLGRIVNNRIGLDVHAATAAAWNTSVRYYGGHFAVGSTLHTDKDRFGIRLSAAPGAYVAHNRHVFDAPDFELNAEGKPIAGIPFLCEVNSRAVVARAMRMEGCSGPVARHTAGAQDHLYEVAWASQAYLVEIEHAATATRLGGTVRATHQAGAHREAREILSIPNLRAAAIRWNATETGFERLASLSSNVMGTPVTVADFTFPALDAFGLTPRGVVLTGGRAIGAVVDTRLCKEFALALDADSPRLMVMTFDANMNLLTDAGGQLVLASGQSVLWNAAARWW
ncbi:phage tail fiber domain-containing protein [Falsiroseomonas oryziterrae]|uniref:phage tail fiber domain-containing protein n=1 Tax=Falsiroseomonas oryziterrae TaxID=2911368 RepID=UPI001EEEC0D6|nr:phage tail fiber protein [Roseomonas sp. NPKOSM-4]